MADLTQLKEYPWTGHLVLMGKVGRAWQNTESILLYFSSKLSKARAEYERFVAEGVLLGRRPDLIGGQEIRIFGGRGSALLRNNYFIRYPVGQFSGDAWPWTSGLCNLEST